jgi:predicted DsbA family dithiol-disulfide isomerase
VTAVVGLRHFTDPTCPFAFSAERQRMRLLWLYGEQLDWTLHLVVLSREEGPPKDKYDLFAKGRRNLFEQYGMPMDWNLPEELGTSYAGCLAVAAAREHAPDACGPMLRALRVRIMAGAQADAPKTLGAAAQDAGLEWTAVQQWMEDPVVLERLQADMTAARSPSPASRAQDYKLGGPEDKRRYTCPSYELRRLTPHSPDWPVAERVDLPGYRPIEAYETALANLAPELSRRADPSDVAEVLEWAPNPLATAEVAAVCDTGITDVRPELARVARFEPVGSDGYWHVG